MTIIEINEVRLIRVDAVGVPWSGERRVYIREFNPIFAFKGLIERVDQWIERGQIDIPADKAGALADAIKKEASNG